MSGTPRKKGHRVSLSLSDIEDLRKKGYNQSEIADMSGVTKQAVSWHKVTYGGFLTPRQVVNKAWPWKTTDLHGRSKPYQYLRNHGEFMATGGKGMSQEKLKRLESWWKKLRDENVVLEFDPNIPPVPGVAPYGGFAYRTRRASDGDLLIRVNEHTNLTDEGRRMWRFPHHNERW
ncbi:Repressor-like immunity protein [Mycobacterium sp. DL592]|uniref:Repressor-like immunity protein n=1 Tax=Mycobacterium sp. DL592 TaxID=2675524 RepID=UPI00141DFA7F|nr:Repressor-like immunity protein [Mycobacterium sp. DL592]